MSVLETVLTSHRAGVHKLDDLVGRGWLEDHEGFTVGVSEVPAPPFNGATVYGAFDPIALRAQMDRVVAAGLPFSLNARPEAAAEATVIAEELGMVTEGGMPLMAITSVPDRPAPDGLRIRRLDPEEGPLHAEIAAEAFGAPVEVMRELAQPRFVAAPGLSFLIGEQDGAAVTTAIADVNLGAAGIFSVATVADARGHGFGAAITAAAVRAAFADGAEAAFLLSAPLARPVYERLGFTELEHWSMWAAMPGDQGCSARTRASAARATSAWSAA